MAGRESIDIEGLVFRAYGEQKIDRLGDVRSKALGLKGPAMLKSSYSIADKVDMSSFSARRVAEVREMQLRLASAPLGLFDLHEVVLGLGDFYLERGPHLDFVVWDADTAEAMGHELIPEKDGDRAKIRKMRRRGGRGEGHDDLETDGEFRLLVVLKTTNLIILHGRHGDRPYVPDVVVSGKTPIYKGQAKKAVGYVPRYETPLHMVVEACATHAAWRAGLSILAEVFARLPGFAVTGPRAPEQVWEGAPHVLVAEAATDLHDDAEIEKLKANKPNLHTHQWVVRQNMATNTQISDSDY